MPPDKVLVVRTIPKAALPASANRAGVGDAAGQGTTGEANTESGAPPMALIVPALVMPPDKVLAKSTIPSPRFPPLALIVPVLVTPPERCCILENDTEGAAPATSADRPGVGGPAGQGAGGEENTLAKVSPLALIVPVL